MIEVVSAYRTTSGQIEHNIERAYARELCNVLEGSSFSSCLVIINNAENIKNLLEEYLAQRESKDNELS